MLCYEALLLAEGFEEARPVARKAVLLMSLCAEHLSPQPHYSFGLRDLKPLLARAGERRRRAAASATAVDEAAIVAASLRAALAPKLTAADAPLFERALEDFFPAFNGGGAMAGVTACAEPLLARVRPAVARQLSRGGAAPPAGLVEKGGQLFEVLSARHGAAVVGAPLSGKSACHEALGAALSQLSRDGEADVCVVGRHVVYPAAASVEDLYGSVHPQTQEWSDGLLPQASAATHPASCRVA
jgi:dynein heavy chain 1